MKQSSFQIRRHRERGMTLFMVAATLIILLGSATLAIDLAVLYVARNEAQRAADSAALAGAKSFISSGFLSGVVSQATAQNLATQEAITIGGQNMIAGQAAQIQTSDVVFDFSIPLNPRITVTAQRTAARGNAVPTLFGKALGFLQADIGATAMAEAFSPAGGSVPIGTGCIKPWIFPNCDPLHAGSSVGNVCNGQAQYVDFNGSITGTQGAIINPGSAPGGVIGMNITLKPGLPGDTPAPSQFYPIQIPPGTNPAICPPCAQNTGSSGPGAALYEMNIACCNTNTLTCGQNVVVDQQTGNMVGPTGQGVRCLIHQATPSCGGSPSSCGQDYLLNPPAISPIIGGAANPNPALAGQAVSSSQSIVTVPLYDGHDPCPGGSCGSSIQIVGFLQMFIEKTGPPQQTVTGYILNVAGCGSGGSGGGSGSGSGGGGSTGGGGGGSGGGGTITGGGASLFPVRLIRP